MVEQTFESVEERAATWAAALRAVDPAVLDGAACERLLDLVVRVGRAEAAVKARLIKRAKEANRWKEDGHRNPEEWLAKKTGTTAGKAKAEQARAEDLAAAPATEQALADGEISPEQAEEVAAAARVDPGSEQELLEVAKREPVVELRRRAGNVRAAATDAAARRERLRRERSFTSWTNREGAFCFRGQGLPEDGARLLAALKPHQDASFAAARVDGRRERPEAYAYDGFMDLLTAAAAAGGGGGVRTGDANGGRREGGGGGVRTGRGGGMAGDADGGRREGGGGSGGNLSDDPDGTGGENGPHDDRSGGSAASGDGHHDDGGGGEGGRLFDDPGGAGDDPSGDDPHDDRPAGDPGGAGGRERVRPPAKVILHVDLTAMNRGHTVPGETCEIAGVGPVPVFVARELLGDAFLALVIADGVDVRNVTHLGRAPTTHQRTALEARGMRCEVPGCWRTTHLEIDHVDGWAITRRTHVDQLAWLCAGRGGHHAQKTHDGFTLTGPPGNRTWHPPPRRRELAGTASGVR